MIGTAVFYQGLAQGFGHYSIADWYRGSVIHVHFDKDCRPTFEFQIIKAFQLFSSMAFMRISMNLGSTVLLVSADGIIILPQVQKILHSHLKLGSQWCWLLGLAHAHSTTKVI